MLTRIVYLLNAITNLDVKTLFTDNESRNKWNSRVKLVVLKKGLIQEVLPTLNTISEWVQILSAKSQPTISLVR